MKRIRDVVRSLDKLLVFEMLVCGAFFGYFLFGLSLKEKIGMAVLIVGVGVFSLIVSLIAVRMMVFFSNRNR